MRWRTRTTACLVALVSTVVFSDASAARAAASGSAADRAAARAFADAALAYTRDGYAAARESERLFAVMKPERCLAAPGLLPSQWDNKRADRAFDLMLAAIFTPMFGPMSRATDRFVAALEGIEVGDARLRSARALWRRSAWVMRMLSRAPEDVCAQLWTWARTGRDGLPLPGVDLRGFDAASVEYVSGSDDVLEAGARQLRALGQGPRRAERLLGGRAFEPVGQVFDRWEKRADAYTERRDVDSRVRAPKGPLSPQP